MGQSCISTIMEQNRPLRFIIIDGQRLRDSDMLRYLVAAFGIIMLLAVTFPVWGSVVLQTETPIVIIQSNSMAPVMERGDLAIVTGTAFSDIDTGPESGDIVIYETEYTDYLIPHRAINRTESGLETRGDANMRQIKFCVAEAGRYRAPSMGCREDEELVNIEQNITADQVKGTVLFVIPSLFW